MEKLIMLLMVMASFSFAEDGQNHLFSTSDTSEIEDKEFLLNYFQQTTEELQQEVEGLTEAQMQYKPSEEKWSISQVLEHIIITEEMLFGMMQEAMNKPTNPERKAEVVIKDDEIIKGITDRSHKAKATPEIEGEGKYTDPSEAMKDFVVQRQLLLEYLKNTSLEDLRDRVNDSPFGPVDAYQSFLYVAGHTARHTLQIEEIKATAGFPSNNKM